MAGTPYLVDSNILLRWVKPDHNDYPVVVSVIDAILRRNDVLCYTSQNVGEFWNTCTRPLDRNGYALSPQETDRRRKNELENARVVPDRPAGPEKGGKIFVPECVALGQAHERRRRPRRARHGAELITGLS